MTKPTPNFEAIFAAARAKMADAGEAASTLVMAREVERLTRKAFLAVAARRPHESITDDEVVDWPTMLKHVRSPEAYAEGFAAMVAAKVHFQPLSLGPMLAELFSCDQFFAGVHAVALEQAVSNNYYTPETKSEPLPEPPLEATAELAPASVTRH